MDTDRIEREIVIAAPVERVWSPPRYIGGKTRLRVVESGFASLDAPEETRRRSLVDNTEGWTTELDGLRQRAEQ